MKLVVRGGRVVDPSQDLDGVLEILIEDGCIAQVDKVHALDDAAVLNIEAGDDPGLKHR